MRFALSFESMREFADDLVGTAGGECSHVQHGAEGGTSTDDAPRPLGLSAVAIDGRHADQGGDLFAVELSQFGEFGEESGGLARATKS